MKIEGVFLHQQMFSVLLQAGKLPRNIFQNSLGGSHVPEPSFVVSTLGVCTCCVLSENLKGVQSDLKNIIIKKITMYMLQYYNIIFALKRFFYGLGAYL
jgi:hypothetical protein